MRGAGLARRGSLLALAALVPAVVAVRVDHSDGAWVDVEHVSGALAGRDCSDVGAYATTGAGRFLSGSAATVDLDTVVAARGVTVTNDGLTASATPGATPLGEDAFVAPLDVAALDGQAPLVNDAIGLSAAGQSAGVLDQFGQARSTGASAGAAGAVTDGGVVMVNEDDPSPSLPSTGSVHLGALVPGVAGVADLRLDLGAVAASATLDACAAPVASARDYGIASLALVQQSAAVAALPTAVTGALTTVGTTVNTLTGSSGLLAGALRSLSGLGLATVTATVTVTGLAAATSAVLATPVTDGVVTVDVGAGTVTADLAELIGGPTGLNGLAPNSGPLDAAVGAEIATRTSALLDGLAASLVAAVDATLRAAAVDVRVTLIGIDVVRVTGTVQQVLAGTATVTLLGAGVGLNVLGALQPVLQSTLFGATGAVATFAGTVDTATAAVLSSLEGALAALDGALSLLVNVQPDQPGAPPGPAVPPGAIRVSALRLGVLDGANAGTAVLFATATAGPNGRL